ncbi:hypothetical protein HMPREF1548_05666 [Clostridium sp. KLE 1755]|nr:hypothetical protein HMPREF1548_05666 [Clostridium sp. KLE 1755]
MINSLVFVETLFFVVILFILFFAFTVQLIRLYFLFYFDWLQLLLQYHWLINIMKIWDKLLLLFIPCPFYNEFINHPGWNRNAPDTI